MLYKGDILCVYNLHVHVYTVCTCRGRTSTLWRTHSEERIHVQSSLSSFVFVVNVDVG